MRHVLLSLVLVATLLLVVTGLNGCAGNSSPAKPTVVSTIFANYDIVRAVGGPYVHNVILLPPRTSPHDYTPTRNDKREVQEASLIIKNGLHLDDWVDPMRATNQKAKVLTIATAIDVKPLQTAELQPDEAAGGGAAAAHVHGPGNPHIWLDPMNQIAATRVITEQLVALDPAHAADFRANAEKYIAQLTALDQQFREVTSHFTQKDFIGFHSAYDYLAHRYGLRQIASLEEVEEAGMTPAQAREVIDLIRKYHIKAIFVETAMPSKDADMIVRETGVKKLVLQPLETYDSLSDTYVGLMEQNLKNLKEALE